MKEHRITVEYDDAMTVYNLVEELNEITSEYGISIEIEDKEYDGYDICIVKIDEDGE
jgi:maltose-binding protein MalE